MVSSKRPYLARQRGGGGRVSRSLCRRSRSDQRLCFFFSGANGISEAFFFAAACKKSLSVWLAGVLVGVSAVTRLSDCIDSCSRCSAHAGIKVAQTGARRAADSVIWPPRHLAAPLQRTNERRGTWSSDTRPPCAPWAVSPPPASLARAIPASIPAPSTPLPVPSALPPSPSPPLPPHPAEPQPWTPPSP